MPSKIFDHHSSDKEHSHHDHDFLHLHRKKAKEITGFRRPGNSNRVRRNSASGPDDHETGRRKAAAAAFAASTDSSSSATSSSSSSSSSTSSGAGTVRPRYENKPRNRGSMSTGALSAMMKDANFNSKPLPPSSAAAVAAATTATASAGVGHRQKHPVEPSSSIQEWAHQMHLKQQRKYWWCMGCHPKPPTLQVPSQRVISRRVQNLEPTHAYA